MLVGYFPPSLEALAAVYQHQLGVPPFLQGQLISNSAGKSPQSKMAYHTMPCIRGLQL